MWLSLSQGGDDNKKHLVVHEFGHVLGHDHKHQRGDLWKLIKPYVNESEMQNDLKEKYDDYKEDVAFEEFEGECKKSKYDPDSVMHYW